MRARLDVSEIEAKTKIRAKYLRALEDEEWGLLPGYTFTKAKPEENARAVAAMTPYWDEWAKSRGPDIVEALAKVRAALGR